MGAASYGPSGILHDRMAQLMQKAGTWGQRLLAAPNENFSFMSPQEATIQLLGGILLASEGRAMFPGFVLRFLGSQSADDINGRWVAIDLSLLVNSLGRHASTLSIH